MRVRPFNQREIDLNTQLCVKMKGSMTILLNFEKGSRDPEREFNFDYSFWSHDRFIQ